MAHFSAGSSGTPATSIVTATVRSAWPSASATNTGNASSAPYASDGGSQFTDSPGASAALANGSPSASSSVPLVGSPIRKVRGSPSASKASEASSNAPWVTVKASSSTAPVRGFTTVICGASSDGSTVMLTLAEADSSSPSLTANVKLSCPLKSLTGT